MLTHVLFIRLQGVGRDHHRGRAGQALKAQVHSFLSCKSVNGYGGSSFSTSRWPGTGSGTRGVGVKGSSALE